MSMEKNCLPSWILRKPHPNTGHVARLNCSEISKCFPVSRTKPVTWLPNWGKGRRERSGERRAWSGGEKDRARPFSQIGRPFTDNKNTS